MIDISTSYMGLDLKSPVIMGSSGLTRSISNLEEADRRGAGAVVLKSLFEEQIKFEIKKVFSVDDLNNSYTEADDYIKNYSRSQTIDEYLQLILEAKKRISIPVIASINCVSSEEWPAFAKEIELAGADGIELNVFILPANPEIKGQEYEKIYFDIIENVKSQVNIPIALKVSNYFSGFGEIAKKLSWTGIKGLVLFNRFFNPDIDIERMKIVPSNLYSSPEELSNSLRWVGLLSDNVQCDICASTGVHDGHGVVKQLLAGAKAVQVCSTLYKNGLEQLDVIHQQLKNWMEVKQYRKISDFTGMMSHKKSMNAAAYYRVQFMKHMAGID